MRISSVAYKSPFPPTPTPCKFNYEYVVAVLIGIKVISKEPSINPNIAVSPGKHLSVLDVVTQTQ